MADNRQEKRPPPTGTIRERVETFKLCGRSAQMLLLENGCWKKFNEWTKAAIASKDVPVIKEMLKLLLIMPTSFSQLMENTGGLPLTVENLLKRTAWKKSEFESDAENDLKMLCASVFARWLRIKKRNGEETDEERIHFVTESGAKGELAKIAYRPGVGFLAVNGKMSVVELRDYPPSNGAQDPSDKEGGSSSASSTPMSSGADKNVELMELDCETKSGNLEGHSDAPQVKVETVSKDDGAHFSASKTGGDFCALDTTDGRDAGCLSTTQGSNSYLIDKPRNTTKVFTSKSRSANLLHEMLTKPEVIKIDQPEGVLEAEETPPSTSTSCKTNLRSIIPNYDLPLEEIEGNLWKNLNDDIENDSNDMCIDESAAAEDVKKNSWKLHRIHFTRRNFIPEVEVTSIQRHVEALRESMVGKADLSSGQVPPLDCPPDFQDKELDEEEGRPTLTIPTQDCEDDIDAGVAKLYDYSMEKWPEPVGMDIMEG